MKNISLLLAFTLLFCNSIFAQGNKILERKKISLDPIKKDFVVSKTNTELQRLSGLKSELTETQKNFRPIYYN